MKQKTIRDPHQNQVSKEPRRKQRGINDNGQKCSAALSRFALPIMEELKGGIEPPFNSGSFIPAASGRGILSVSRNYGSGALLILPANSKPMIRRHQTNGRTITSPSLVRRLNPKKTR